MVVGWCPGCGGEVGLGPNPWLGARVTCPACNAYLETIALSPAELDWAFDLPEGELRYDSESSDRVDNW
jgi:lysine biosynthesis protein LysW